MASASVTLPFLTVILTLMGPYMVCATSPVTVLAVPPVALLLGVAVLLAAGLVVLAEAPALGAGPALAEAGDGATAVVLWALNGSRQNRAAAVLTIARMTRRKGVPFVVRTRRFHDGSGAAGRQRPAVRRLRRRSV